MEDERLHPSDYEDRFEDAWNAVAPPRLEEYLPPPDDPRRGEVLFRLLRADLEHRLDHELPAAVADYLARFPELMSSDAGRAHLVALFTKEFILRNRAILHGLSKTSFLASIEESLRDEVAAAIAADTAYRDTQLSFVSGSTIPPESRFPPGARDSTDDYEGQGLASLTSPLPDLPGLPPPGADKDSREFPRRFGPFLLVDILGEGGMGRVFLAHDSRLRTQVALKIPHAKFLCDARFIDLFYREASVLSKLFNPNLCRVFNVDCIDKIHYMSMAVVRGSNLRDAPCASYRETADVIHTVARALIDVHREGVVHCDLKPENIVRSENGKPVVMDFGMALELTTGGQRNSRSGGGTLPFMSPEQAWGDVFEMGPWCDVYSLGVVLYEQLCGKLPFRATSRVQLHRQITTFDILAPPPSFHQPDVPPELERICLKAIEKSRTKRYATMTEFADALEHYLAGQTEGQQRIARALVRYEFAGMGQQAPAQTGRQDRLYLDVGNALQPGVIDHHHLADSKSSTTREVLSHPELIQQSIKRWRLPTDPFTIVVHDFPDLDCIAAAYLATQYLEKGEFPFEANLLADYVDRIDSGELGMSLDNPQSLYAACLQLNHRQSWQDEPAPVIWERCLRSALEVVDYALAKSIEQGLPLEQVAALKCRQVFTRYDEQEIQGDAERYEEKLADPRCAARRTRLTLPNVSGGTTPVDALFVSDVQGTEDESRSMFFKDWARNDTKRCPEQGGFTALCVYASEQGDHPRRCIISVKPKRGVHLQGLARRLDQLESLRRRELFNGIDDRVQDPETGEPRVFRKGYANADPWYDGRAHAYTIIDSPRSGTRLTREEIEFELLDFGLALLSDLRPVTPEA